MRYVGGDYDQFDDDDEEEIEDDEDERDDDDEESSSSSSQSRVNPFGGSSSLGNRPTSSLPGAGARTSPPPSSSSSSGSRPPMGSSGAPGGNRPGTPGGSGSSPGGGTSPFGGGSRPAGSSPTSPGGSSGGSGSTFGSGNRPTGSSGSSFGGGSSGSGSSSSGGSSPFGSGSRPAGSNPSSPGGSSSGSSSSPSRPAGSSGSSFGGGSSGSGSSSSGGSSPFGGGSRPAGSSASSAPPGGAKPAAPAAKPDDKKSGGMLGGITGRFGGGGGDKPATPKSSSSGGSALGGITSGLSGITGRFGGGGAKADKPATPKSSNSGGGLLGGITGRFGGGAKAGDKKPASPTSSSSSSSSPFGGTRSTGTNPTVGGSKPATSSTGGSSPFGRLGGNTAPGTKPATPKGSGSGKSGLGRFLPSFLSGGDSGAKPAPKTRTSKAPTLDENAGLSLDTKLDILGIALLLGSLALIFSRLSSTEGKLTQAINGFLIEIAGWGSIAIPVAMLLIGVWLIARHFGESAPVVPRKRIIGIVIGYVALLTLMSYIDTFNFVGNRAVHNFAELALQMQLSLQNQTGGGRIGWEIYYFLVSNVTEAGAFFMIILLLIISSMFTLDIGAAELAMIIISNARTFQDTRRRRAEQRQAAAAASLEQLTAQTPAAPAVSVAKEAAPALPAASTAALPSANEAAALPAGEPVRAERPIAINIGGKKEVGGFGTAEMVPVERESAAPAAKPTGAPTPSPAGGITGRFGSMIPGRNKSPEPAAAKAEAAPNTAAKPSVATTAAAATAGAIAGGVGRLFNRGGKDDSAKPADKTAAPPTPASQPAAATMNATASATASAAPAPVRAPVPPPATAPSAPNKQEPPPARLGELMKPATSPASSSAAPASPSGSSFGTSSSPARPAFSSGGSSTGSPSSPTSPVRTSGEMPKVMGAPGGTGSTSTASPFGAPKSPAASSPFKSPVSSFSAKRPEDELDEPFDEFDDDIDEMDDSEELTNLSPAQPKGMGEPLPRNQNSRFGASTFGSSKPSDVPDRNGRLNEIRQGGVPVSTPPSSKPNEKAADKPATPMGQPAAASAAPSNGGTLKMSPFGKPTTPASGSNPFGKPATPPPAAPNKSAVPAGDSKTPQPAGAFWKDNPAAATPAATPAAPAKAYEPEKSETPRPKVEPAAASFGKPPDPPGVTINPGGRDGMASAPLAAPPPPPAHTAAAAVPDATPIGRSPEIPLRQPGVGTMAPTNVPRKRKDWRMPNIGQVLMPGSENDFDRAELLRRAKTIEETLQSFGAPGKVVEVNTGPVITQFGVEPDYLVTRSGKKNRVKVGAIAQLDKDLQLALGAKSIRIEAPVPGKGYVGIEVPNDEASLVSLRDVMESDQFKKLITKSPLAIALGQSVDGTPISADLGVMPHLLIAGTTGSGKSVCVNAIITSLITMNPPDRVKFIMVDPKRVELTGYNGIPHLVAPVVVELERIVGVLKWVTREMDERYKKFSQAGARNIEDFNKHLQPEAEIMPYIIVIIDELADLMMMAPDETERVITRIAALARATGIHLVIATQRPSVDVVTGLIKANFPARIAFAVAGGVDSRVILDQPGAERLLGKGDMLYMSGDAPAALRLQGVFVSDQEIQNITRYWKSQISADDVAARPINALVVDNTVAEPSRSVIEGNERTQAQQAFWDTDMKSNTTAGNGAGRGDDDVSDDQEDVLYEEAVEMVRRLGKASVSLLQRRLRIGYTRSARLIDRMEEEGIIGPAVEGAKPREVLPMK